MIHRPRMAAYIHCRTHAWGLLEFLLSNCRTKESATDLVGVNLERILSAAHKELYFRSRLLALTWTDFLTCHLQVA